MREGCRDRLLALLLAAMGMTTGLAGCKPGRALRAGVVVDNGVKSAEPRPKPAAAAVAAGGSVSGTVSGVVRLHGRMPERTVIDMSPDLVCALAEGEKLSEQMVGRDGGLGNVFVYVKSGPAAAMQVAPMRVEEAAASDPVELDQTGCRYVPHVVGVERGGVVEFRNLDGTRHSFRTVSTANPAFEVVQGAKGAPERRRFEAAETMVGVRGRSHPWMNAVVHVVETPYFAVSDATGRFDLTGLPPGTYTLAAIHERLGERTVQVTVGAGSQTTVGFSYTAP